MRTIVAVRHGRTAWNLARRFQGHTDIPLDEEGRAQARALAERLRGERLDYAVCSDLARARETGEILTAGRGVPLMCDARWREMCFGYWEGMTWEEITRAYPDAAAGGETGCERYRPEGGEAFGELCLRVTAALEELSATLPADAHVLLVTHAGPLHALLRIFEVMNDKENLAVRFTPADVMRLVCSEKKWTLDADASTLPKSVPMPAPATLKKTAAFGSLEVSIVAPDEGIARETREHIDALTKPLGSLGRIEELAVRLAAIAGGIPTHNYERKTVLVGAADHGIAVEGVSAYPPEVTVQMVAGFLKGDAAINAFARTVGAEVYVADFGMREPIAPHARLLDARVGRGTANFAYGPAMTEEEVERSLNAGMAAFDEIARKAPFDVIALGEMGIGNTTAAAAIICAFTGKPPSAIVGRGTGVDDKRLARKIVVVERALGRLRDHTWQEIAREVGGYEIVGLAGVILAAARARVPVVLDGFIVAASALLANAIAPQTTGYCIAAHRSREIGHAFALEALGLQPLLDLDFCLGEASGAVLALPLVEAAARMMREMRTFEQAGVAVKEEESVAALTT